MTRRGSRKSGERERHGFGTVLTGRNPRAPTRVSCQSLALPWKTVALGPQGQTEPLGSSR